ncbi:hypothetical protein PPYR_08384 [Photinus pyralis]|uniref:Uncharacterized protein n=1 Tax=Photinus pyralis TaxID=7054 RepID=A0A5N4AJ58_PHOPY|nr:hypothetical protein PPYR_08384 [Photinus pyralis]
MSTKEWLTKKQMEVFESVLKSIGIDKYSIRFSAGVKEGENFAGIIINAEVEDETKIIKSVWNCVIKCVPRSDLFRLYAPVKNMYNVEIYVYIGLPDVPV